MPLPRLRPVEFFPVRIHGRKMIGVRDPEGIVEDTVLLPPDVALVASLLDGNRDVVDVQAEYARHSGGEILFRAEVERIVAELDRAGLLFTESFEARRRDQLEAYRRSEVRPPYLAGRSYPAEAEPLRAMLRRHLDAVNTAELAGIRPRGIIAPHIDFHRGGWCYGWAYAALRQSPARTFLLLGVAHAAPPAPFVLTAKAFQTPLGVVPVDSAFVEALQTRTGDLTEHELVHRTEHSLEFQVLFLQTALEGRAFAIVPILCSGFEQWCGLNSPREVAEIERVIRTLRELVNDREDVAVVVGVDLSHVGPRFGDPEPPDTRLASRTSLRDHTILEAIVRGEPEAFWREGMADGNRQRIDALSAVYTALRVLEPVRARLLRYGQAPDPAGGIVSFASLVLG
ncbi:MAG: AmmeMemoRadiSam system protein B [Armatimonadota bacterium]|nr:AmmeMemoRadiSam system protein B [Armatimonadota bacterium]MDR7562896.1 AmmeMemoRadiSam system protein B [Armatimonadota bacterium]MDR7568842.1 AmmeMemoRadiSam system protein B [Armatimonadota bacterium]MDR7601467.1 AmmeMemoRadiSam system protein B [Armatimonadota bacterium]